ncbi:MAG: glycoside hydrolase superfamily [Monoraphidium minutum]|nr:MAG: glycoside hydrolase superfamily [Monoraphidium minutum]
MYSRLALALVAVLAIGAADRALAKPVAGKQSVDTPPPEHCSKRIRQSINWGVATAAYQIEGAWNESGRTPSVWDTLVHTPGNVKNNDTGDVACDHYHKYKQDFRLMKEMGIKNYRFSFSWSRILPEGGRGSAVSAEGIAFYNDLIDEMLLNDIAPAATMFHWDLPQVLHDKYHGPLSDEFVEDFVNYADVLFENFGDRVKYWMTFNEPLMTCDASYGFGKFAPAFKGGHVALYSCAHHVLLAHATTSRLAKDKYRKQRAKVGIALNVEWAEPMTSSAEDKAAAQRNLDIQFGLFADPLFLGKYPDLLRAKFGDAARELTPEQSKLVKGSLDFIGINHYTSRFVKANGNPLGFATSVWGSDGKEIGPVAQSNWLRVFPDGLYKITQYVTQRYGRPEIFITENGVSVPGENDKPRDEAVRDGFRVNFFKDYLGALCRSKRDGARVGAYFAWSFMDNFEWLQGYSERFGITYVDFASPNKERTVKDSGRYLSEHFFKANVASMRRRI